MRTQYLHSDLTDKIIKCFYKVYNTLGYGFLEKVYEKALCIELDKLGLEIKQQHPINVYYENQLIGEFPNNITGLEQLNIGYNYITSVYSSLVNSNLTRKGSLIWKIGRKIEDYTYRNADSIIVISESMKNNIRNTKEY